MKKNLSVRIDWQGEPVVCQVEYWKGHDGTRHSPPESDEVNVITISDEIYGQNISVPEDEDELSLLHAKVLGRIYKKNNWI